MHTSSLEKPTRRRDPLRWIALGALLLAFVLICCVSQVVTYLMTPRNQASDLDLLSKNQADYSVWLDELWLPNIGPEVVEAIASDLATPTPGEVAALPAVPLEVVPAVPGAPTPTPAGVNPVIVTLTPTPTVTVTPGSPEPSALPGRPPGKYASVRVMLPNTNPRPAPAP